MFEPFPGGRGWESGEIVREDPRGWDKGLRSVGRGVGSCAAVLPGVVVTPQVVPRGEGGVRSRRRQLGSKGPCRVVFTTCGDEGDQVGRESAPEVGVCQRQGAHFFKEGPDDPWRMQLRVVPDGSARESFQDCFPKSPVAALVTLVAVVREALDRC